MVRQWLVCDRCGKEYKSEDDVLEIQEFHRIRFQGGYGSVFGDTTTVSCDLCQHCLKDLIIRFCWIDGKKHVPNS